ncbi:hypothetical protein IG631_18199 [Alternaria alternata]|nr:hypothetical protein IG631_18199 [Alternaria alternata]
MPAPMLGKMPSFELKPHKYPHRYHISGTPRRTEISAGRMERLASQAILREQCWCHAKRCLRLILRGEPCARILLDCQVVSMLPFRA